MEQFICRPDLLELISIPAYTVIDGVVEAANGGAQNLLITPGTPAEALVETGLEDYKVLSDGCCLSLMIRAGEKRYCAFARREGERDLIILDQEENDPIQLALSMASSSFRTPLSTILNGLHNFRAAQPEVDPSADRYLNDVTKGAYQILRLVANMSDVIPYTQEPLYCQVVDLVQELRQSVEKAAAMLEKRIQVRFVSELPEQLATVNMVKLERAVHNLLLNAATYASQTEAPWVQVELKRVENRLHICVTDNGRGISDFIFSSLFNRYRRTPSIENCRYGIGLGLPLARLVAAAHGGTVLVERLSPGTRVTMTLNVLGSDRPILKAPNYYFDYASEFDHALVELSPMVPSEFYDM